MCWEGIPGGPRVPGWQSAHCSGPPGSGLLLGSLPCTDSQDLLSLVLVAELEKPRRRVCHLRDQAWGTPSGASEPLWGLRWVVDPSRGHGLRGPTCPRLSCQLLELFPCSGVGVGTQYQPTAGGWGGCGQMLWGAPKHQNCLGSSPSKGVVTLVVDRKAVVCLSEVGGTHWGSRVWAWATPALCSVRAGLSPERSSWSLWREVMAGPLTCVLPGVVRVHPVHGSPFAGLL